MSTTESDGVATYQGSAAEGLVKVTVTGGRIADVDLSRRVLKRANVDIGEAFAEAANRALARFEAEVSSTALPGADAFRQRIQQLLDDQHRQQDEMVTEGLRNVARIRELSEPYM